MTTKLNSEQLRMRYLALIQAQEASGGFSLSIREIADLWRLSSTGTYYALQKLVDARLVIYKNGRYRAA